MESRSILSGNVGKARRQAARKRELRAAGLVDDRRHVIEVPLVADAREAMLIDQRLLQLGRLRNSILGTLRGRADKLRADPGWLSAGRLPAATAAERSARTDAFRVPRERYRIADFRRHGERVAQKHWPAAYQDHVSWITAQVLAAEVCTSIEQWLYGAADRPEFKRALERDAAWGGAPAAGGLTITNDRATITWRTKAMTSSRLHPALARNALELELDWSALSRSRRARAEAARIARVGVVRRVVRGNERYFALLCLEGAPYRNEDWLEQVRAQAATTVGLDLGVSLVSASSIDAGVETLLLCDSRLIAERREQAIILRRTQRALDRSRRAMNPDCFDARGRSIRGKRQSAESRRGRRLRQQLTDRQRKATARKAVDRTVLVRRVIAERGGTVFAEAIRHASWQARWGKRMLLTTTGRLRRAAEARARDHRRLLHGAIVTSVPMGV